MATTPLHLLRNTATIREMTTTRDSGGSAVQTWADKQTGVKCSIQPMIASKASRYGAERAGRMYSVFMDPSTNIADDDALQYTDDRTGSNVTRYLLVRSAPINLIERDVVLELDCEAVKSLET